MEPPGKVENMATKDQERKALEEIKAIVDRIGGDQSYIGMAFKGCFDIAEENIANDFGDSWMDRWSNAVDENSKVREENRELQKACDVLNAELEAVKDQLEKVRDARDQWRETAETTVEDLTKIRGQLYEAQSENSKLENETIRLKAKLYDLMTA